MAGVPPVGLAVEPVAVGAIVVPEVALKKLALTVRPLSFIGGR